MFPSVDGGVPISLGHRRLSILDPGPRAAGLKEGMELAAWLLLVFALRRARPATAGPRGGSPGIYDLGPVARPFGAPRPPVRRGAEASPMGYRQGEQG